MQIVAVANQKGRLYAHAARCRAIGAWASVFVPSGASICQ